MINGYEGGYITARETASRVIDFISHTNVELIVTLLPDPIMRPLLEIVASASQTDDDWEKCRIYSVSSYCGQFNSLLPIETDAEREFREANERAKYRNQVEILRNYLATYDKE